MQGLALPGATSSFAYGINNSGEIVGSMFTANGQQAFVYNDGQFQTLGTLADAWAINNSGEILGGGNFDNILYTNGAFINLNQLTAGSGWDIRNAWAINDSGEIVGQGANPAGQDEAFLLTVTVVPEPGSMSLFALGGLGLLARRRRWARCLTGRG